MIHISNSGAGGPTNWTWDQENMEWATNTNKKILLLLVLTSSDL